MSFGRIKSSFVHNLYLIFTSAYKIETSAYKIGPARKMPARGEEFGGDGGVRRVPDLVTQIEKEAARGTQPFLIAGVDGGTAARVYNLLA